MDKKKLLLLAAALLVAVGTAFAARSLFMGASTPQVQAKVEPTGPKVLVAQRALPTGTIVTADSIKGVVTTMVQTERYGTPLASALRVLSAEFRNERMMRAEEKAARLPAIMTVPLILFILPVLFVVILGPAACSISDAFSGEGPGGGPK